ncbi:MAG: hypothetical protein M5U12_05325 [Verrucomicrobia bacterium]|nr:hypothetical protein [Verrucomicrobiota bacterium]
MARLFLSMSGEGRGHATRARALVQALAAGHELTLFAPGDAYAFLAPLYAGSRVRVERLPGLRFAYDARHRLRYLGTLRLVARYLKALPAIVNWLSELMRRERPDLAITGFRAGTAARGATLRRALLEPGPPALSLRVRFARAAVAVAPPRRLHALDCGGLLLRPGGNGRVFLLLSPLAPGGAGG